MPGNQIMALAAGGTTYKLKFGHRGHNQPCQEDATKACVITSQNHGYAIDEKTLPKDWRVSYRNLNDNSVEGIAHKNKPYFSGAVSPRGLPWPDRLCRIVQKVRRFIMKSLPVPVILNLFQDPYGRNNVCDMAWMLKQVQDAASQVA